jgi:hypothetical protein
MSAALYHSPLRPASIDRPWSSTSSNRRIRARRPGWLPARAQATSRTTLSRSYAAGLTRPRTCGGRRPARRRRRINGRRKDALGSASLSARRPGHHEINLAGTARRTYQPLAPIEDRCAGAVSSRHHGRVGLHLMLAGFAPDDQTDPASSIGSMQA